jgi:glycosyltransferase involved in cell wall biosynthesis
LAPRIALCHDWLTGMRGGERVLESLAGLYPQSDLYTLVHVPGATSAAIESLRIHASVLSRLPGAARHYRVLLPLFPWAVERMRIARCDAVVSTSHAFAKGVRVPRDVPHLCYCHTPMRYVWDQIDPYLGPRGGARRIAAAPLVAYLRHWDRSTSDATRVTRFAANSRTVAERIRRHYGREAQVIYPPVRVQRFQPSREPPADFYLLVGGFVPYKREELAIEAFRRLGRTLLVAGDGPRRARLEARAPGNVRFLGRVSDEQLGELYARCRALIYPQEEDFGLIAVEVQAAGRPVIAFAGGGATETVVPLGGPQSPTGVWFRDPTPESLCAALLEFEKHEGEFSARAIRRNAERFGEQRFRSEIQRCLESLIRA